MENTFKSSVFGGFNRDDVIRYIEKTSLESKQQIEALEQESDGLCRENAELRDKLAAAERERDQLAESYDTASGAQEALKKGLTAAQETITELRAQIEEGAQKLASAKADCDRQLKAKEEAAEQRIAELEAQAKAAQQAFASEKALAVREATSEQGEKIVALKGQVTAAQLERDQVEAQLRQEMTEKLGYKDQAIRDKEDEIDRLRNQRSRLSVKLIGETLEQHCEMEFNRVRMMAFPKAEFHKDNDVVDGTKGDYVFRELDDSGVEVVSIMFDMKNEDDNSTNRKRNEDHLKKLDKDRRDKGCEYAVLVSTLEPESELYNTGIVDVSYLYPKMYVIRPQFFIPIISILRNASLSALSYKAELAEVRNQNIDITHFEEQMEDFKAKFRDKGGTLEDIIVHVERRPLDEDAII